MAESAREIRNLSDDDIFEREKELRESLFNLRFQFAAGELADHTSMKKAKRDLARILTVLRERRNVQ